eukprot:713244-Pelagomonas_calceolata.AAC.3
MTTSRHGQRNDHGRALSSLRSLVTQTPRHSPIHMADASRLGQLFGRSRALFIHHGLRGFHGADRSSVCIKNC